MGRIPISTAALAIETVGLSKSYGDFASLTDCNLQLEAGQIYGLLGPNGAGKTTLIRILLGFIKPSGGRAHVCGYDIVAESLKVREQVSYLPADARLYRSMRGTQVLELFAGLHRHGDLHRSRAVAERLGLDLSRRVMFMSTGMRQKLAIAVVLGCDAPLVVLDEPTANLDPHVRSEVLALAREIRGRGNTVLLSSHIFGDIDEACDRVGIIRGGRLIAEQQISALQELHLVQVQGASAAIDALQQQPPEFVDTVERSEHEATLTLTGLPDEWLDWLTRQPVQVVTIERAGIEAVYNRFARGSTV